MKDLFDSPNIVLLSQRDLGSAPTFVEQHKLGVRSQPTFFLEDYLIEKMQHGNAGYKNLREIYAAGGGIDSQLHKLLYGPSYRYRVALFEDAYVTSEGLIHSKGEVFRNGGCPCSKEIAQQDFLGRNLPRYKKVVSMTAMWSGEVWHFVAEALASLVSLLDDLDTNGKKGIFQSALFNGETYLHIGRKNSFSLQWINIIFGGAIDDSRVIEGDLFAEQLIIPEMGRCGWPYADQLLWLNRVIQTNLREAFPVSSPSAKDKIVLIKRNSNRAVGNYTELYETVRAFSSMHRKELYIHDDASLPSVLEQLKAFSESSIIIAPHGAGCINALAASPGTSLIELFDENWLNICFAGLAYKLNLDYFGLLMKPGAIVNTDNLQKILAQITPSAVATQLLV